MDDLKQKARNYYILGLYAEKRSMNSEAVPNYFKALFAVCGHFLQEKTGKVPKDHNERFRVLESKDLFLYRLLD